MSIVKLEWINKTKENPLKCIHYGGIVIYHNKLNKIIYCTPKYTYFENSNKIKTLYYTSHYENNVKDFDLWAKFPIHDFINKIVNGPFDILYDLNIDNNSYFSFLPLDLIKKILFILTNKNFY
jgi:hypothetical protein